MEVLGYMGALIMGLVLGALGGGGSILTVPILVYLFRLEPVTATGISLFVVGATSAAGILSHHRQGNVAWRTAALFGSASIISVFITRRWVVPAIPDPIVHIGDLTLDRGTAILSLFAVVMVLSAWSMIRGRKEDDIPRKAGGTVHLVLTGLLVGVLTGILGAGGGFLIVPALVLAAGLDMKQAVGTSLIIIAAKSLIGFTGDLKGNEAIDWNFLLFFSVVAIAGIITVNAFIGFLGDRDVHLADHIGMLLPFLALAIIGIVLGVRWSERIPSAKLRPAFGRFVLVMGIYIIIRELYNMG